MELPEYVGPALAVAGGSGAHRRDHAYPSVRCPRCGGARGGRRRHRDGKRGAPSILSQGLGRSRDGAREGGEGWSALGKSGRDP